MSNTVLVIQFFTFVFNLFLGFFVLIKNPRYQISWYFWVLAIGIAGWNFSLFITISELGQLLFWGRLAFSFGALMPMGLYLFAISFPQKDPLFEAKALAAILLGGFFFFISFTNFFIKSVQVVDRIYVTGSFTPVLLMYMLYSFGVLMISFINLFSKYNHSSGIQRMQLKYVNAGILAFFLPLFFTQLILPIFGIFRFNNLGPLFSIPMVSMVMYAITRYRFLDIRLVIQRSVFYLVLITIATALYVGLLAIVQGFLLPRSGSIFSSVITSIFIILGYPGFKEFFDRKTDKLFFKGSYEYWEALGDLSQALVSDIDQKQLLEKIGQSMKKYLKTDMIKFWKEPGTLYQDFFQEIKSFKNDVIVCEELDYKIKNPKDKNKELYSEFRKISKEFDAAIIIPVFYQNSFKGIFLIGKKLSGDPFVKKDIRILNIFANHAGSVFNNAELYEEIKNYNLTLETKVQDRTQELKRLFDAQSRFLVDISHELQTPLSVIKGNISSLSREVKLNKHQKTFGIIDETINNVSVLLNNLMSLAKLDFEQMKFDQKPMGLHKLLEDTYDSFGPLASDKEISFNFKVIPENGQFIIKGNTALIKQLFLNLLSNAIKFTDAKGHITITLTEDPQTVTVLVEDTGIGIPEQDLPHIFERFYQATNGEFKKGIGLGLAICKKIVDGHKGSISVSSKEGEGSKFTVVFTRIYETL